MSNITSFYGSSCANNSKDALNTQETLSYSVTVLPYHSITVSQYYSARVPSKAVVREYSLGGSWMRAYDGPIGP
eukprot:9504067-Pyramimonas_sp.AAC.3